MRRERSEMFAWATTKLWSIMSRAGPIWSEPWAKNFNRWRLAYSLWLASLYCLCLDRRPYAISHMLFATWRNKNDSRKNIKSAHVDAFSRGNLCRGIFLGFE